MVLNVKVAYSACKSTVHGSCLLPISTLAQRLFLAAGPTPRYTLSAGSYHTCAITLNGTATCWGRDKYGQSHVPATLGPVNQISTSSGGSSSCAIAVNGSVVCWGDTLYGNFLVPHNLPPAVQLSTGNSYACAIFRNGSLSCWGAKTKMPNGDPGPLSAPVGLGPVVEVSAGPNHVCAIPANGSLVCWGSWGASDANIAGSSVQRMDYGQATVPAGLGPVYQVY